MKIPQEILNKLEFEYIGDDPIPKKVSIRRNEQCDQCHRFVTDRVVELANNENYWRHRCSSCKKLSIDGETWYTGQQFKKIVRDLKKNK